MSKRQLIEEIRKYNEDAAPTFLSQFTPADLRQYLEHLKAAQQRSGRLAQFLPRTARLRMVS